MAKFSKVGPICALKPKSVAILKMAGVANFFWDPSQTIKYYFFDLNTDRSSVKTNVGRRIVSWRGDNSAKSNVRRAINEYKNLGLSLTFQEVENRADAQIRIGFQKFGGNYSEVGTSALSINNPNERTMNISDYEDMNIVLHEIGHVLGLHHEHQHPNCPIEWNREATYKFFFDNYNWSRSMVNNNIFRRIIQGRMTPNWDKDSIMQYKFESGLINSPAAFRSGLNPKGGLSVLDKIVIPLLYPVV